jgi:cytochrome c oxidase cbb3-type subunit 1
VRLIGGGIFFSGMLLMAYNTWRTVQASVPAEAIASAQMA